MTTEFQQRAAAAGVVKMFTGTRFSICDLDNIAATIGRKDRLAGRDYDALRTLHCMEWADMGSELKSMAKEKCLELLGLPPEVINVAVVEKQEPAHEPAKRLRLALWK